MRGVTEREMILEALALRPGEADLWKRFDRLMTRAHEHAANTGGRMPASLIKSEVLSAAEVRMTQIESAASRRSASATIINDRKGAR